ncbi:putative mitochondrial carrier protein [Aspergillus alliaceus]|uniref:putative mitochondrial carrier protein n=1 Tax=Petromyces alliaceus TaxID=209559 RepID=UPI0012A4F796|nr:mitochondrial carrier domain-containing protein [Aspergillus alliaceus]KAB8231000.1 mitochondrial carrier domain-containing protein [Aspergillus alliaceus]
MPEYEVSYNPELDTYSLYQRYEEPQPNKDWKTAALRGPALPALGNAVAGAVGAAISNVATYPLSLIIARLQTQSQHKPKKPKTNGEGEQDKKEDKDAENDTEEDEEEYKDILDAARKIYAREGLGSFYTGLAQDTAKTVADSFLFFLAYGFFRQRRINARYGAARKGGKHVVLPILDELAVGVLAGAFAKLFTTPLANIVARKQTSKSSVSTRNIAARIRAEKGIKGFWSGYSASLILTLNPSITFFLNEFLKYTFFPREKRAKPSAAATFLLAAVSKSAASSVTYPFSMAKTRAQVTGSGSSPSTKKGNNGEKEDPDEGLSLVPPIISNVISIARTEGITALYAGLPAEVLKGFFSHGFTMLAKDAVYSIIVQSYYLLLITLRRYPTPDELVERARQQAEEWAEAAREGARDLAEKVNDTDATILDHNPGNVAIEMASSGRIPPAMDLPEGNETADLVGDYVEDEATEWRSLYHWFWEKEKYGKE